MSPPRPALEFVKEETAMQVQPYLFFDGRCDEALEFYKKAIGAKVDMLMRFKDAPDQSMISPGSHDKVMHAAVHIGETQVLMSDGRCLGKPNFQGFALTISAPDTAEAERRFTALAEGGQVQMPLAETFFASRFGMLADKFGVGWMIMVEKK
jgi:PhnB protein